MKIKIKIRYLVVILLMTIFSFFYFFAKPSKNYIEYSGYEFVFRDSIEAASKVLTYPNEKIVYDLFWDPNITSIKILFKPSSSMNPYYAAEVFELTYKLSLIYRLNAVAKNFMAEPIDSYENIEGERNILKIILVPPGIANETRVIADGNKIYIYAKNFRDFDLATMKVIICAMGNSEWLK